MALEDVMGRNYQWTIYLDIDLIITNVNTKMEEFFLDENFDIVLPIDCNGINTGVEMFRGTDSNYRLLRSLWTFTEYKQKYFQEQTALWLAIGRDRNVARRVKLIPPGVLQSYQDASCGAKFEDGDFIWHFPGILSSEELADNMKRYTKLGTLSNTFDIPKVEGNTCNCTLLT
ncbi:hypothetical protein Gasu2_64350 [Galdieria sulphuraria]|nr:hypothetical protein Gasu2_64350 [Galdieria sulphuraria]